MLLWEDPYMRVEIDRGQRLVRQTRSARAYDDLTALDRSMQDMLEHMQTVSRAEYTLLQDVRAPRGRHDPEFEKAITRHLEAFSSGFRKFAVLVATHVGKLQVQRHLGATSAPAKAFLDEGEALEWLKEA